MAPRSTPYTGLSLEHNSGFQNVEMPVSNFEEKKDPLIVRRSHQSLALDEVSDDFSGFLRNVKLMLQSSYQGFTSCPIQDIETCKESIRLMVSLNESHVRLCF